MHRHLVAVEVSVVSRADQRVELYSSALYQYRLECLDTEAVEGRRTVQQYGVTLNNVLKRVPNDGLHALDGVLRAVDVELRVCAYIGKALDDERLEKLESHFLRQTALIHFQLRAYYDNGTAGVVNTFTEQVLTETSLLTFQHIRKRLESAVVRACYRSAVAAVVDKGVYRFLQHSLFVSYDDVGSFQLEHSLESVISVDNSSVQVVQVAGSVSAAVEHYHRAKFGRDNGYYVEYHPFGSVSRSSESFYYFQSFEQLYLLLAGGQIFKLCFQLGRELFKVDLFKQLFYSLSAHACLECVVVLFAHLNVVFLAEKLALGKLGVAGVDNYILGEVENFLQPFLADFYHLTYSRGSTLEVPDVRYGCCKLDMAHSLASYVLLRDNYAAALAYLAFKVLLLLVLSAVAGPVLSRSKDPFAEKTVLFRLLGAVIYSFRAGHLTVRPFSDLFGRSERDFY